MQRGLWGVDVRQNACWRLEVDGKKELVVKLE